MYQGKKEGMNRKEYTESVLGMIQDSEWDKNDVRVYCQGSGGRQSTSD